MAIQYFLFTLLITEGYLFTYFHIHIWNKITLVYIHKRKSWFLSFLLLPSTTHNKVLICACSLTLFFSSLFSITFQFLPQNFYFLFCCISKNWPFIWTFCWIHATHLCLYDFHNGLMTFWCLLTMLVKYSGIYDIFPPSNVTSVFAPVMNLNILFVQSEYHFQPAQFYCWTQIQFLPDHLSACPVPVT